MSGKFSAVLLAVLCLTGTPLPACLPNVAVVIPAASREETPERLQACIATGLVNAVSGDPAGLRI